VQTLKREQNRINAEVAEAAVVGRPDELTGEAVCAFVVLKGPRPNGEEAKKIAKELRDWVGKEIGAIAKAGKGWAFDRARLGAALPARAGDAAIPWRAWDPGLAEAQKSKRPVLVDVYTQWCGWCRRMDKDVYARADVRASRKSATPSNRPSSGIPLPLRPSG